MDDLSDRMGKEIKNLNGPILVTGAAGFIGAALLKQLLVYRNDVYGTYHSSSWRVSSVSNGNLMVLDLTDQKELIFELDRIRPKTIFNLAAHGSYPDQTDSDRITKVNFQAVQYIAEWSARNKCSIIQAGSSSEYGTNCSGPAETDSMEPNSLYAVTKLSATQALEYYSKSFGLAAYVLRLYSVYGPLEDPNRLIPALIRNGMSNELPPFSPRDVSRDFVYVDDVVNAFVTAGLQCNSVGGFQIYNVCSGVATTMESVANATKALFGISADPVYGQPMRLWDLKKWYGNPSKILKDLDWSVSTQFETGLELTRNWYLENDALSYLSVDVMSESRSVRRKKVSAIIACYKDAQAIPIMYTRLRSTFESLNVDFEIIFVNDASPDNSLDEIERLSKDDDHVIGVTHSRNFGSQAAFLSGLTISTGDACILLDGDLQDPPELITEFFMQWENGYEVVYGRRISRDAPWFMRIAYRMFYRLLASVSSFEIPRDAGDFSLMSRRVIDQILQFPERELFLRASRAYLGHRQIGVDYVRPERTFGQSSNNLLRNIGWAVRGFLAVSKAPLTLVSMVGSALFGLSIMGLVGQVIFRLLVPSSSPPGIVSVITVSTLFGSLNLLAISIVGAYVGRILEETKNRPRFVTELITRNGQSSVFDTMD